MSTVGRRDGSAPAASAVAARLREAGFVRLLAAADGGALAAVGVLADALGDAGVPYQASVVPRPDDGASATEADCVLALGRESGAADLSLAEAPASGPAYGAARELGDPDPVLGLAGVLAAGDVPEGQILEDARAAGIERRPGVGVPTDDPAEGLAHSTLVHGPFSGDTEAARELLADAESHDADDRRRVASLVALAVAGDPESTARGAEAVQRVLRPYAGGPFGTVAGYADVLGAVARERPGLGVTLALGTGDRERALAVWRDHGRRAHEAIRSATTGRYDGLFVARVPEGTPVGTVARLLWEFRSPEPAVLVVAERRAATVGPDEADLGAAMAEAATAVGGTGDGTPSRARARFDGDPAAFVLAFREAR
jgi:hypothetical protein